MGVKIWRAFCYFGGLLFTCCMLTQQLFLRCIVQNEKVLIGVLLILDIFQLYKVCFKTL